jgi:hypothetical protein
MFSVVAAAGMSAIDEVLRKPATRELERLLDGLPRGVASVEIPALWLAEIRAECNAPAWERDLRFRVLRKNGFEGWCEIVKVVAAESPRSDGL